MYTGILRQARKIMHLATWLPTRSVSRIADRWFSSRLWTPFGFWRNAAGADPGGAPGFAFCGADS
ncbi:MAG: hypothetical protein ACI80K_004453 [Paracoccaceae bacterium]|jgi:hypothetical protein